MIWTSTAPLALALVLLGGCVSKAGEDTAPVEETASTEDTTETLYNAPAAACLPAPVTPDQGETGDFAAVRLVPSRWPFLVSSLHYTMVGGDAVEGCDSTLPHTLLVFASADAVPPTDPTLLASFDVATGPNAALSREITEAFPEPNPLAIAEGERIYIAVQMVDNGDVHTCLDACNNASVVTDAETDWHSNTPTPPYAWESMWEKHRYTIATISATGRWE